MREAVFRFLFDPAPAKSRLHSPLSRETLSKWKVYFIGIDRDKDPSDRLLKRFAGNNPSVKPVSASFHDSKAADAIMYGIKDKTSKKIGVVFSVGRLHWLNTQSVEVHSGYLSGGLNGFWADLTVVYEKRRWRVKKMDHIVKA